MKLRLSVLALYALAMALLEAAVVVYLRALYYPQGFLVKSAADLAAIPRSVYFIELLREAATLLMLAAVAWLAYRSRRHRIWAFIFAFSVWDLGYYLFLYLFLRWPASLAVTDVYFLIPRPSLGPVWVPLVLFAALGIWSGKTLLRAGE